MQQIIVANIKPTITTTPYPLGYKYNCDVIYSRVKLPSKAFTKREAEFSKQWNFTMWVTET